MEKHTMGALMAALRKAKGLTQQDVADRLLVSNKTISKWERDDGCPDISMLPAIAELYGITVDELLRGEVKSDSKPVTEGAEQRTEQQRQYLMDAARVRFRSFSVVGLCLGILSPVAAIEVGLGFFRCYLALGAAAVFAAAALMIQVIAVNKYIFMLGRGGEAMPSEALRPYYRTLKIACFLTGSAVLFGLCVGIGGTIGCPDGFSYNNLVLESPWVYLVWLVLSGIAYAVLSAAIGKRTDPIQHPLFSRRAKGVIAVGLVVLTAACAVGPYLYETAAAKETYTFQSEAQKTAFEEWFEGEKLLLLQTNSAERTLYLFGTAVAEPDIQYDHDLLENAECYPAEDLTPPLRIKDFDAGAPVSVLAFSTVAQMQAFADENCVDYAALEGMPVTDMQYIVETSDTAVTYQSYLVNYSAFAAMLFALAADAVWLAAWFAVGMVRRKKEKSA